MTRKPTNLGTNVATVRKPSVTAPPTSTAASGADMRRSFQGARAGLAREGPGDERRRTYQKVRPRCPRGDGSSRGPRATHLASEAMSTSVLWLRRDLRLADHPALL